MSPRSNRLMRATTTPRTAASVSPLSQDLNSGSGLMRKMAEL
jgi:hypothetical protein